MNIFLGKSKNRAETGYWGEFLLFVFKEALKFIIYGVYH